MTGKGKLTFEQRLEQLPDQAGPIGIFDSGYGGLTVFKAIEQQLPQYDYLYLGDNARAPYGPRSFESIYQYTLECVQYLFLHGCRLVILACNTASAKALRTIQQKDLVRLPRHYRVLGVIRPTTEIIGTFTKTNQIGLVATSGTVNSDSYGIELKKFFPTVRLTQQACPMWVPLIENNEHENSGADFFVKKCLDELLSKAPDMDVLLLACTHYPLLEPKIKAHIPNYIHVLGQGEIVAKSLENYLERHLEMKELCSTNGDRRFLTTDKTAIFDTHAGIFLGREIQSERVSVNKELFD